MKVTLSRVHRFVLFLWVALVTASATAQTGSFETGSPQDSYSRHPVTGDWTFQFYHPEDKTRSTVWRYVPRHKIKPSVRSIVRFDGKEFDYRYRIRNAAEANQAIAYIWLRGWFTVQGLPAELTDHQVRTLTSQQLWDLTEIRGQAERSLRDRMLFSAPGWDRRWSIDLKAGEVNFGWFPDAKDDSNHGLKPGAQQGGFGISRPELPGIAFAEMQGYVKHPPIIGGGPSVGPVADALRQLEEENTVWTHVLVPAITPPVPWDAAEFVTRVQAHIQKWPKWKAMRPAALNRLNPKLDALVIAARNKNKRAVERITTDILTDIFETQPGMTIERSLDDDDAVWQTPLPIERTNGLDTLFPRSGPRPAMERIAVRALSFNLFYLLTRMNIGK
ncbi:MAG: hypothetical protein KA335_05205 [Ramlibacter sp.]|jgi:hypothetical protein|nr:hypothetical protein [Ramlibacter sp.]